MRLSNTELKNRFIKSIIVNSSVKIGAYTVAETRSYKINKMSESKFRPILFTDLPYSDPNFLKLSSECLAKVICKLKSQVLVGIETQGLPISYAASALLNIPSVYVRKKRRLMGEPSFFTGRIAKENHSILVVDNFCFSGDTFRDAVKKIATEFGPNLKFHLYSFVSFVNRPSINCQLIGDVTHTYLFTLPELVEELLKNKYFPESFIPFIKNFIRSPSSFTEDALVYRAFCQELDSYIQNKSGIECGLVLHNKPWHN